MTHPAGAKGLKTSLITTYVEKGASKNSDVRQSQKPFLKVSVKKQLAEIIIPIIKKPKFLSFNLFYILESITF